MPSAKGHLDQQYIYTRSTTRKRKINLPTTLAVKDQIEPIEQIEESTNLVSFKIWQIKRATREHKIATAQTGRFHVKSNRGNEYAMVAYVYDPNAILVEPMKYRKEHEIIRDYGVIHQRLQQHKFKPRFQRLDNEASTTFQADLSAKKIDFQLVPPNIHRRNAAERAIRTFKNHFIAGLSSVHSTFPMQLWCRLLQQAELTLNLLRPSRLNPKLSAYAQLEGSFDFNRTPLVPPGVKTLVYETPSQRGSWSPHGVEG